MVKSIVQSRMYYIIVDGPFKEPIPALRQNYAGESVVFEGRTTRAAAIQEAQRYLGKAWRVCILNSRGTVVAGWSNGRRVD